MEEHESWEISWNMDESNDGIIIKSYFCPDCGIVLKYEEQCIRCIK